MRCQTCGFMNSPGSKVCSKCGTYLKPQNSSNSSNNPPYNNMQSYYDSMPTERSLRPQQPEVPAAPQFKCDNCGHYPLQAQVSKVTPCPNCRATGEKPLPIVDTEPKTTLFQNIIFDKGATKKQSKIALIDLSTNKPLVFEGDDIILNRANLNPKDKSISSSQHVQLTKENNQWQLQDLSSNQATFVQATGKVTIENGVHILIGTRIYKIEIE